MKKVLVCALDWGLGHATRCIPVIREWQRQGAEVLMACSGSAGVILKEEFPDLTYIELPGYNPRYSNGLPLVLAMAPQLSGFRATISKEHAVVEQLVATHRIDVIISDNRYGCYSSKVPSVIITHQTKLRMGGIWIAVEPFINGLLTKWIRKFNEVWVPDQPGSGLTEPLMSASIPFTYVGWLSRFNATIDSERKYGVMMIVSGPEPQRTAFENILKEQAQNKNLNMILVTGRPGERLNKQEDSLRIENHLPTSEMSAAISASSVIVARSGYTTVMDLIALGKKAVFVPTPQQPEQQWLASFLHNRGIVYSLPQNRFDLEKALKAVDETSGLGSFRKQEGLLESAIRKLM